MRGVSRGGEVLGVVVRVGVVVVRVVAGRRMRVVGSGGGVGGLELLPGQQRGPADRPAPERRPRT